MNHQFKDISAQVFGALTVTNYYGRDKHGQALWECDCLCGKSCIAQGSALRSGSKLSCGCRFSRVLPDNGATFNELYYRYRASEHKRGLQFELTREQFMSLVAGACYYCDRQPYSEMNTTTRRQNSAIIYNGIDRVDNDKGYTIDNCVSCCKECNHAKHTLTQSQFISMCRLVARKFEGIDV